MPRKKIWDGTPEDEVTKELVDHLGSIGFYDTGTKAKDLPAAREISGWYFRNAVVKKSGKNSPGQPDLWIRDCSWPTGLWLTVEVKGRERGPRFEPAQKRLLETDDLVAVWSVDMLDAAINQVWAELASLL